MNVLAVPAGPPVAQLESVGVRRVSTGSLLAGAAYAALLAGARELRQDGTSRYAVPGLPDEIRRAAFDAQGGGGTVASGGGPARA